MANILRTANERGYINEAGYRSCILSIHVMELDKGEMYDLGAITMTIHEPMSADEYNDSLGKSLDVSIDHYLTLEVTILI